MAICFAIPIYAGVTAISVIDSDVQREIIGIDAHKGKFALGGFTDAFSRKGLRSCWRSG
jgi:hypothetical protein